LVGRWRTCILACLGFSVPFIAPVQVGALNGKVLDHGSARVRAHDRVSANDAAQTWLAFVEAGTVGPSLTVRT
jgi:hypothetical protein